MCEFGTFSCTGQEAEEKTRKRCSGPATALAPGQPWRRGGHAQSPLPPFALPPTAASAGAPSPSVASMPRRPTPQGAGSSSTSSGTRDTTTTTAATTTTTTSSSSSGGGGHGSGQAAAPLPGFSYKPSVRVASLREIQAEESARHGVEAVPAVTATGSALKKPTRTTKRAPDVSTEWSRGLAFAAPVPVSSLSHIQREQSAAAEAEELEMLLLEQVLALSAAEHCCATASGSASPPAKRVAGGTVSRAAGTKGGGGKGKAGGASDRQDGPRRGSGSSQCHHATSGHGGGPGPGRGPLSGPGRATGRSHGATVPVPGQPLAGLLGTNVGSVFRSDVRPDQRQTTQKL